MGAIGRHSSSFVPPVITMSTSPDTVGVVTPTTPLSPEESSPADGDVTPSASPKSVKQQVIRKQEGTIAPKAPPKGDAGVPLVGMPPSEVRHDPLPSNNAHIVSDPSSTDSNFAGRTLSYRERDSDMVRGSSLVMRGNSLIVRENSLVMRGVSQSSLQMKDAITRGVSGVLIGEFVTLNNDPHACIDKAALEKQQKEGGATVFIPGETNMEDHIKNQMSEEAHLASVSLSEGLSTKEAELLLKQHGPNCLPEKKTSKLLLFFSLLVQPMPVMIWLAIIIEGAIQNWPDMGILLGIQFLNAFLSYYETTKAGDAVEALKSSLKPTAICYRDGSWQKINATLLVPGDLVELAAGGTVPADCMLNSGTVDVDESAMTGESLPVTLLTREMAKMGGTVVRGEEHATVVYTGAQTFFGKTAHMIQQSGGGHSNLQLLLIKIMLILTVLSLVLCGIVLAYLLAKGEDFKSSLSFAVVLLVASIPIAIEIVVTTTLAVGSRKMSAFGGIVSRLNAIEDLAGMNMLCSDKTGTLTKNKMEIQDATPVFGDGVGLDQKDMLRYAAMATKWELAPKDALDTLVLRCSRWIDSYDEKRDAFLKEHPDLPPVDIQALLEAEIQKEINTQLQNYERLDYMPFDPVIKRTEGILKDKVTDVNFAVTKGAPHVILHLEHDDALVHKVEEIVKDLSSEGIRSIAIARSEPLKNYVFGEKIQTRWHFLGLLTFLDPPRGDTKETLIRAQGLGVPVRMITGDNVLIAKKTCIDLNLGTNIEIATHLPKLLAGGEIPSDLVSTYGCHIKSADGFAQVFPEHKFLIVECYRKMGYCAGMTGDGVNDAPALKRADVGIAVAGATDAARAAADIVLTADGLSTIVDAIEIAREIFQRMKSFLTYRIAATLQLLIFFFIAVFAFQPSKYLPVPMPVGMPAGEEPWPHFFKMPVLLLMLITLLNDGTLISVGYDNVTASKIPEVWNLKVIFCISSVLGAFSMGSSLLLLWLMLDSWNNDGFFQKTGLGGLTYGQITMAVYLKVSISDFLTLFSARTVDQPMYSCRPHPILLFGACFALTVSTIIAVCVPSANLDEQSIQGLGMRKPYALTVYIWLFCIFFWILQDITKVFLYRVILKYNIFGAKNPRKIVEFPEGGSSPSSSAVEVLPTRPAADTVGVQVEMKSGH